MTAEQSAKKSQRESSNSFSLKDALCLATVFAGLSLPSLSAAKSDAVEAPAQPGIGLKGDLGTMRMPFPVTIPTSTQKVSVAKDFELKNLNDEKVSLSKVIKDNPGKVVLVKFGASWCPPCRASTPQLNELHEKYGDKLVILDVNSGESKETAKRYAAAHGTKYTTVLDSDLAVGRSYGVTGIPAFFLVKVVDGKNTIVFEQSGYGSTAQDKQAFHDAIVKHFEKKN